MNSELIAKVSKLMQMTLDRLSAKLDADMMPEVHFPTEDFEAMVEGSICNEQGNVLVEVMEIFHAHGITAVTDDGNLEFRKKYTQEEIVTYGFCKQYPLQEAFTEGTLANSAYMLKLITYLAEATSF